jgi:hypothetical protein
MCLGIESMTEVLRLQLSYPDEDDPDMAQVRVEQSPSGESRHRMEPPFKPAAVRGLLQVLEKGDLDRCRLDDEELAALRALGVIQAGRLLGAEARNEIIGQRLFEALFPISGDPDHNVRGALEAALTQAQLGGEAVPFQLRFDRDAVDLARLPWELICTQDEHLVAEKRLCLTRYITFAQATTPFPVADRLEVLVVTARPVDLAAIDATAERQAIEEAFEGLQASSRLRVHLLAPPTLDALVAAVNARPYHVVHFDGHGAFARRCPFCQEFQAAGLPFCATPDCGARLDEAALQGCLAFERSESNRASHLVSAREVATALSGSRVRLFVASACQSGTVGGESVFGSVGPRLILAGVPAVVSMQFSVPVDSAVSFAGEFYAALARGESIAAAAAAGRCMLYSRGTWYIPAIYLRNRDGEGFLFRFQDSVGVRGEVMDCDARRTCLYLRRTATRPLDWGALRPREAAPYKFLSPYEATDTVVFHGRDGETQRLAAEVFHQPFVVLHGSPGVGKTSLVNAGLIPALLENGYLVLTIREYGDPVAMLCQVIGASPALEVDLTGVEDLSGLVDALQRDIRRPLVVVFDAFEAFLRADDMARREAFVTQFAACAKASHPLPACMVLVLREGSLGHLTAFEPRLPEILDKHSRFPLRLMTREQAEEAIVGPLARHEPPMACDEAFLRDTLLPDLYTAEEGEAINPTHLQIVCHELYHAALQARVRVIGRDLYPAGGTKAILSDYLEGKLQERFRDPAWQELARVLLKQMVTPAGERNYVTAAKAAEDTGAELDRTHVVLDALLEDGLLELRPAPDGTATYSLSHYELAAEVQRWFDRKEALARCAQDTLDRAWDDWYDKWYVARREEAEGEADVRELLVGPARLQEIRQWRQRVSIESALFCLLLHSAVHHRVDMDYWAHQIQEDDQARQLLAQIHRGPEGEVSEEMDLARRALGLLPGDVGEQALARAAVAHQDGTVRHVAALGLGALGLDALHQGMMILATTTPRGRRWRRAQALAQIKSVGFPLPQLSFGMQRLVAVWATGLDLWNNRWQILAEILASGLGAGLGLGLCLLFSTLLFSRDDLRVMSGFVLVLRSLYLQPIGFVVGSLAVAMVWLIFLSLQAPSERTRTVGRIVGLWLGFLLGLVIFWLPLDLYGQALGRRPEIPSGKDSLQTYLLGGSFWGLGIGLGREALAGFQARTMARRTLLGGGLGGALGCVLAAVLGITTPLVEPSGILAVRAAEASLAGFGLGGGLAGGWELGAKLGSWLQARHR